MPLNARPHSHTFHRPPEFVRHVRALAAVFGRQANPITLATIQHTYHLDAHAHIDARHQEHLLSLDAPLGQHVALYSLRLVQNAVAAQAAAAGRALGLGLGYILCSQLADYRLGEGGKGVDESDGKVNL